MRITSIMAVALMGTLITGCAPMPTQQEIAAADYGPYPNHYADIAKTYYASILKDPESAKYQSITLPRGGALGTRFTGMKYGYLVCATLNAKNSYGGYTGNQTDALLIRDGAVIEYVKNGVWFNKQLC